MLATGARHAYFGHDAWEPFAPGLKTLEDATTIRSRILLAFEEAEREEDERKRAALMTFVIVGAGPTGVELAGTIAELARATLPGDFRRIDTREARIVLIEAGPRVLPAFAQDLSAYANIRWSGSASGSRSGSRSRNAAPKGSSSAESRWPRRRSSGRPAFKPLPPRSGSTRRRTARDVSRLNPT